MKPDYSAQLDWTGIKRKAITSELHRFAEQHLRQTGKHIYPLRAREDDGQERAEREWRHPFDPAEHPDWDLKLSPTGAWVPSDWEPAPAIPFGPRSVVGSKAASVVERMREERAGDPVRQASSPRRQRSRRDGEVTITEYARLKGLRPRRLRKVLTGLRVLQEELVGHAVPMVCDAEQMRIAYKHTARLSPEAIAKGWGRRLEPRGGTPYDVLTPAGQQWLDTRLGETQEAPQTNKRLAAREAIRRLADEGRSQVEIARCTGYSKQLVSYHLRRLVA